MDCKEWADSEYNRLLRAANVITRNNEITAQELLHYSLLIFLEKSNIKDILDSGGATFYCIRIMLNSYNSKSSPFARLYLSKFEPLYDINYESYSEPIEDDSVTLSAQIEAELSSLYWYDRELFKLLVEEDHTISSLSRVTGIPRRSISSVINRVRKHIKNKLNNER